MMTTWRDYLLNKCYTHTWMIYIPGIPLDLDYPEILGLRVPLATLVQNDNEDQLFTIGEMHRADSILGEVYAKAGAADRYKCTFYPGPHKFDRPMQAEAFALVRAMAEGVSQASLSRRMRLRSWLLHHRFELAARSETIGTDAPGSSWKSHCW